MTQLKQKLFVALGSLVVFFGAAEIVLRLVDYQLPPLVLPLIIWNPEEDKRLADGEALHEPAARQLWRPRADANVPWGAADDERINPFGYRGPVLAKAKTPGVLRIATFGDSSTFGMGVRWSETYSARLVEELASRGVPAEVIDAGVIGFTIEQGFERYQELVRELHPDVVTLAFGACNEHFPTRDLEDREKIAETARRAAERRPVIDWVRENVRVVYPFVELQEWRRGVDRKKLYAELGKKRSEIRKGEKGMGAVDWPGMRRVSVARFEEDLTKFVETVRADGAKTVVLISMTRSPQVVADEPVLLEYNAVVERVGAKLGAPVFDARARVAAELAGGAKWEQLFVDFYHPSPKGHALFARELADLIAPPR
ncbi:MAG: SGNH/GDSL hydrolase family protein [Planctomycetes bacterium]|nr:SGNH/GDSL hydrolase family protein [Planctomycetota bacterium]